MSSPTPPKKAAPKAKLPLNASIQLPGGKVVIKVVEGEDALRNLDHRGAKDFGLLLVDAVKAEARG